MWAQLPEALGPFCLGLCGSTLSPVQYLYESRVLAMAVHLACCAWRCRSAQPWWRFSCGVFDGDDNAVDNQEQGWATCQMSGLNGLRLVAILERVQGGLLGETLSSFGITGLYITGAPAGLSQVLLVQLVLAAGMLPSAVEDSIVVPPLCCIGNTGMPPTTQGPPH